MKTAEEWAFDKTCGIESSYGPSSLDHLVASVEADYTEEELLKAINTTLPTSAMKTTKQKKIFTVSPKTPMVEIVKYLGKRYSEKLARSLIRQRSVKWKQAK